MAINPDECLTARQACPQRPANAVFQNQDMPAKQQAFVA